MKSRSDTDTWLVPPLAYLEGRPPEHDGERLWPCGLRAASFFNDTFQIFREPRDNDSNVTAPSWATAGGDHCGSEQWPCPNSRRRP